MAVGSAAKQPPPVMTTSPAERAELVSKLSADVIEGYKAGLLTREQAIMLSPGKDFCGFLLFSSIGYHRWTEKGRLEKIFAAFYTFLFCGPGRPKAGERETGQFFSD